MIRKLFVAALLASSAPALSMPDFIPKPGNVYDDYVALEMPRTEVPVGALWVQGYGPTGEGAAADNLMTERSLTQITINTDLHLGLTAGILNLFGMDPSYRNKLSARFGDLSIVRVKEMAKLSGPSSEPRIYEAIRAGSVTITTDNEVGLKLETRALGQNLPVVGRGDNGRRRSFSIDGKDMFIAFRVASQEVVKSDVEQVKLKWTEDGWATELGGRDVVMLPTGGTCSAGASQPLPAAPTRLATDAPLDAIVPVPAAVAGPAPILPTPPIDQATAWPSRVSSPDDLARDVALDRVSATAGFPLPSAAPPVPQRQQQSAQVTLPTTSEAIAPRADNSVLLSLRVPVADGAGGMFETAVITPTGKQTESGKPLSLACASPVPSIKANVQLLGSRLQAYREPKAPRW